MNSPLKQGESVRASGSWAAECGTSAPNLQLRYRTELKNTHPEC